MKYLEKIVFFIVLLLVAGVAAWVFIGGPGERPSEGDVPAINRGFELKAYQRMFIPDDAEWPEPEFQDAEGKWLYRVFTPPKLYIVDGAFDPELPFVGPPPPEPDPPPPFGVRLVEIDRKLYRLQLSAVFEQDMDNIDSAILSFENVYATETQLPTIRARKEEVNEEFNFRVDDIERIEIRAENGGLEIVHTVTVTDLDSGRIVLLSDSEPLFEEGVTLIFASTVDTGEEAIVRNVGETFVMNDATYTVSEINLERSTVELVKEAEYLDVPERETLNPQPTSPVTVEPAPEPTPSEDEGSGIDFFFN
ncbi:MAG: hypothetical protein AAGJ81_11570 [Verrucomicrobiota bacterium]